jgi:hypothetical protein
MTVPLALGAALVVLGGAGTVWAVIASTTRRRPVDLLAAIAAPVALVLALVGGVLLFVPDFLR